MKIQESGENYLETILLLENRMGSVRSIDIAHELNYSKPSISRAMSILRKANLITTNEEGDILLTESGRIKANEIYERHQVIAQYLIMTLEIDQETADQDACKMEHIISQSSFEKMKLLVKKGIYL